MKSVLLKISLNPTSQQARSLLALQHAFAEVCNAISPTVRDKRCWNRVTLHHLSYRSLRERFPKVGSQMVCNAIYSVSRTCRVIFQNPQSPLHIQKLGDKPLPLLQFLPSSPVYFDRHTLSIIRGVLSMYTLEGRMRFQVELPPQVEARFTKDRLQEVVLSGAGLQYTLTLSFAVDDAVTTDGVQVEAVWPQYVVLQDMGGLTLGHEAANWAMFMKEQAQTQAGEFL